MRNPKSALSQTDIRQLVFVAGINDFALANHATTIGSHVTAMHSRETAIRVRESAISNHKSAGECYQTAAFNLAIAGIRGLVPPKFDVQVASSDTTITAPRFANLLKKRANQRSVSGVLPDFGIAFPAISAETGSQENKSTASKSLLLLNCQRRY